MLADVATDVGWVCLDLGVARSCELLLALVID